MSPQVWRWGIGLIYILAVAIIWIAASFIVQSVVDSGVSPFLITYICNSLFMVYLPIAELQRYLQDCVGSFWFWPSTTSGNSKNKNDSNAQKNAVVDDGNDSEQVVLLRENDGSRVEMSQRVEEAEFDEIVQVDVSGVQVNGGLDAKGRWTRARTAKVSLLICPFWFLAQLTFNLSLKYTTITSNTILSSASSLFTFVAALLFLGETHTWVKLIGVLLCMGGTVMVSWSDSASGLSAIAANPVLGDILALVSACFYAVYVTLIRKKLPDGENVKDGTASMVEFLGYLGLFNLLIFLPVALVLNFTKLEPFHVLSWKQVGLIVGKGLFDNVLSDYLWAKAVLLTSTTVATAGLSIQVPLAAIVDSLTGHPPHLMDYLGAASVMVGFAGINIPSDDCSSPKDSNSEREETLTIACEQQSLQVRAEVA